MADPNLPVWRPKKFAFSVQTKMGDREWYEVARFWMENDAIAFCQLESRTNEMRIAKGRKILHSYSGPEARAHA